jgi:hypothetical protein
MPRDARLPRRHPVRITFGAPVQAAALAGDATDPRQRAEQLAVGLQDRVAALAPAPAPPD